MRKLLRPLAAAALTTGAVALSSSAALAAAPTGDFAPFKYCPYTNTAVTTCLQSVTTSGSFKLGNATVPITADTPVTLQGGFTLDNTTALTTWYDAVGADTLSKTRMKVPGGLAGLVDTGGLTGLLITALNNAIAAENDVYATAELVGPVKFDFLSFFFGDSTPAVTLPIRVHLENPFLGSSCYIGSSSSPVTLKLTDGTTSPPAPNTPITGSAGDITTNDDGSVTTAAGNTLVDNSFSVPAATDCGITFLDRLLVTPAVNLKEGLPSAAGNNTAILTGTTKIGDRALTAASVQ
jgi:hypothetical protein